jgi:hypothetical protein
MSRWSEDHSYVVRIHKPVSLGTLLQPVVSTAGTRGFAPHSAVQATIEIGLEHSHTPLVVKLFCVSPEVPGPVNASTNEFIKKLRQAVGVVEHVRLPEKYIRHRQKAEFVQSVKDFSRYRSKRCYFALRVGISDFLHTVFNASKRSLLRALVTIARAIWFSEVFAPLRRLPVSA